jgi:hypothetical protein
MQRFFLALLGIGIFTGIFIGILALRPLSMPQRTITLSGPTPVRVATPTPAEALTPPPLIPAPVTPPPPSPPPTKHIIVTLSDQNLRYFEDDRLVGEFKISSGLRTTPTPPGDYTVLAKKPTVNYFGEDYRFPNTKWNLMFKEHSPLNYYIHGAYWHRNFGHPMSHGCVNVAYANMEGLYNWADVGTRITIE